LAGRADTTLDLGPAHRWDLGAGVLNVGLRQKETGCFWNPSVLINIKKMFALPRVGFCVNGTLNGAAFRDSWRRSGAESQYISIPN
jgi:hypothetical protein